MSTHADECTSNIPPLSGVITCTKTEEYSWPGTMIPPSYLIFHSSPGGRLHLTTHEERRKKKERNIHTRISIFYFCYFLLSKL